MSTIDFALAVTPTSTPAVLSNLGGVPGTTQLSWSISSDTQQGNLYLSVRPASAGVPTSAQIESGDGGVATAVVAVTNPTRSGTLEGLTPSTNYTLWVVQKIGDTYSNVAEISFETGAVGTAQASINIQHQAGIAERMAVYLECSVSNFDGIVEDLNRENYDPSFSPLLYRWTVTRNGQSYQVRRHEHLGRLPLAHNDTNTAYGKRIGHVFTRSGTYNVQCEVIDQNHQTAIAFTQIIVPDADEVYDGAKTILVNPTGLPDADYPGAEVVTTIAAARIAAQGSIPKRILILRGTTWETNDLYVNGAHPDTYVSAYGPETDPKPQVGNAGQYGAAVEDAFSNTVIFENLNLSDPSGEGWDSTSETGNGGGLGIRAPESNNPKTIIAIGLDISGWGEAIQSPRAENINIQHATYIHDCNITNNRFYVGQIVPKSPGSGYVITGTCISSDVDAFIGGPKNGLFNNHGPLRIASVGWCYIGATEMYSGNGWFQTNGTPFAKGPDIQAAMRYITSNNYATPTNNQLVAERCVFESGWSMTNNGTGYNWAHQILLDKCILLGHSAITDLIVLECCGATVRNTYLVTPDAPNSTNRGRAMIRAGLRSNPIQRNTDWPVEIYNNTQVDLRSVANQEGFSNKGIILNEDLGYAAGVAQERNNILETPFDDVGDLGLLLSQTRLETITGFHTPGWPGPKWNASSQAQGQSQTNLTEHATPPDTMREWKPLPGSAAIAAAEGSGPNPLCAIDDFWGTLRPVPIGQRSQGASEPD